MQDESRGLLENVQDVALDTSQAAFVTYDLGQARPGPLPSASWSARRCGL